MESVASRLSSFAWTPSLGYPTATQTVKTLSSINPDAVPSLSMSIVNAVSSLATATYAGDLVLLSRVIRGAEASLTALGAQQVLATATNSQVAAEATKILFEAAYNLSELEHEENIYSYVMNRGVNIFYLVMFFLISMFNIGMLYKSRYHWYNITFICGFLLEFIGFLGRVLSSTDYTNINYYLLQYAPLTISAAFLMGGIYFIFAQNVVLYGREYTVLKPMWYSYFFVASDILCLLVQGTGGGMASSATKNKTNPKPGKWIMFAGVLAQVISMSVFLVFWFNFLWRLYFRHSKDIDDSHKLKKKGPLNFIRLLLHLPSTHLYKQTQLERFYAPKYIELRQRKLVPYFPLAITVSVIAIYIRCIYRVIELKQGFTGYLITHEVYIMVLDVLFILIVGLIFIPFHPVFVLGAKNTLKIATVRGKETDDEKPDRKLTHSITTEDGSYNTSV